MGIFWVVLGGAVIDSTPLETAEEYGEFEVHPGSHYAVWSELQEVGIVPAHVEYEEPPRGRVVYNSETHRFTLLADKCILQNEGVLSQIVSVLHLPQNTRKAGDDHYRCSDCLRRGDVFK